MSLASPVPVQHRVVRLPIRPSIRARVLFVSPSHEHSNFWRAVLLRGHFAVDLAAAETSVRDLAARHSVDVIVIDRSDATFDALALCHDLRASGVPASILVLHPHGNLDDLLDGFEAGADAYLYGQVGHLELFSRLDELSRPSASARL